MSRFEQLIAVQHPDAHVRRRGRMLAMLSLAMIVLAALFIPVSLLGATPVSGTLTIAIVILIKSLQENRRVYAHG